MMEGVQRSDVSQNVPVTAFTWVPAMGVGLLALGYLAVALAHTFGVGSRIWGFGAALVFPALLSIAACLVAFVLFLLSATVRLLRTRFNLALSVVALAVSLAVVLGQLVGSPQPVPPRAVPSSETAGELRALAWNVERKESSPSRLAELVSDTEADIAVFSEISMDDADRESFSRNSSRNFQFLSAPNIPIVLLVGIDLGEYEVTSSDQSGAWTGLVAEPIDANSNSPRIVAVHVVRMNPVPWHEDFWGFGLDWVAQQCGEAATIALGDFNADSVNMPGGRLGECRVPPATADVRFAPTWPTTLPATLGGAIDHVMVTPDWSTTYGRALDIHANMSDHRPIFSVLTPTGNSERN